MNNIKTIGLDVIMDGLVVASVIASLLSQSISMCRMTVLIILIMCIIQGKKETSFFNPYYLFIITPFSLLIYKPLTNSFMMELSVDTWIIIIINMIAFIYGVRYMKNHTLPCGIHTGQNYNNLEIHSYVLISIASFSALYEFLSGSRLSFGSMFTVCYIPALMCALKTKQKIVIVTITSIFILGQIAILSKAAILVILISLAIGLEAYFFDKKSKYMAFVYSTMSIVLIVASFSFGTKGKEAISSDEKLYYYQRYHQMEWSGPSFLAAPYLYMTTPWTNLQYVMQTEQEHTYGLWMAKPFIGYLQMEKMVPGAYKLDAYSSFNTFSFVAVHYLDFGFWLSIIPSFLLGLFVGRYYSRYLTTNSPLDVAVYVLIARATLMMFFSNHFFCLSYPFTIVIIMWLYKTLNSYKI